MKEHYHFLITVAFRLLFRPLFYVARRAPAASGILLLALALVASGCASVPTGTELRATRAVLPQARQGVEADGRAAFRRIFCAVAESHGVPRARSGGTCETLLWRLEDEAAGEPAGAAPPLDTRLRVFIVGGAFSDCFGAASIVYRDGMAALEAAGLKVTEIPISGRSSAAYNAEFIARELTVAPPGRVLLLGYSKGTVDILEFLANYPALARRVEAVISVAGPVFGSQLAERGHWAYEVFLRQAFSGRCDPGDGGVLDSLLPEARQQWWAVHPLPQNIRYYSLLAFTTAEHIARALGPSWQILAATDPRNDGQITIAEGVLPGSTLLGYANTDHWGVAIDIEEELDFLAAREDDTPFPRGVLLEALVRYVGADLAAQPGATESDNVGPVPVAAVSAAAPGIAR